MSTKVKYKAELINDKPVLYYKPNPEGKWVNITETLYDVDKLEFYDRNLNVFKFSECRKQGESPCQSELNGLIFNIVLLLDCYHIKYGDALIWSYCIEPYHRLPLRLQFNLKNNRMSLFFIDWTTQPLSMQGYENDWVEPGKPLQKFKNKRIIKLGNKKSVVFGEGQPSSDLVFEGEVVWSTKGPLPISVIVDKYGFTPIFPMPDLC